MNTSTERSASSTPRTAGGEARVTGLSGVFRELVQEHNELTAQLLELRLSSDSELRAQQFPELKKALLAHERAEAKVLYLLMSKKEQTRLIAGKHRRTAGEIETLVERLSTLDYASDRWESMFALLFEAFEQHTIEEESYNFPIAQRVLGEAKVEALRVQYEEARVV